MDLSSPLAAITPTLDAGVLQVLSATTGACTAAEVHRRLGRNSDEGVRKVLSRLVGQGVVAIDASSRYPLYWLNREHVAAPYIEGMTRVRQQILERITTEVNEWVISPLQVSVFGSFARGTADANSDIDVLVIHAETQGFDEDAWSEQLSRLKDRVLNWTGNGAQVIDLTEGDLHRLASARDPLIESLLADGISLVGPRLNELLRVSS